MRRPGAPNSSSSSPAPARLPTILLVNQSSSTFDPPGSAPAAPPSVLERIGRFFFAWRNLLFTGVLIALLGGLRPVTFLASRHAAQWLDRLGILLAVAGQSLRIAVMGTARIQHGGRRARVFAEQLNTTGLFNHVRNPLYLGNLLVLLGLFVIHNNPWVYGVGLAFFL